MELEEASYYMSDILICLDSGWVGLLFDERYSTYENGMYSN